MNLRTPIHPPEPAEAVPPTPPPPPAPRRSTARVITGVLLVLAGVAALLHQLGAVRLSVAAFGAAALVVVGLAVVVLALQRQEPHGLMVVGVVLTLLLAAGVTFRPLGSISFTEGAGDRTVTPTAADLDDGYGLGVGQLKLDLTGVAFPEGRTALRASVGMGELHVTVPRDVGVRIVAEVAMGEMVLFGEQTSGVGLSRTVTTDGYESATRQLELTASVGMGRIEVRFDDRAR
jgi:hypothetical protein